MNLCQKTLCGLTALSLLLSAAGCASPKHNPEEMTVEQLYNRALDLLIKDREYTKAIAAFDEIDRYYPYSKWAVKSQIMLAFTHYVKKQYDDAIIVLDRFIQLYPGNKYAPYAYYLKALCYYDQISDPRRDQEMTKLALDVLESIEIRFPQTAYAKDSAVKADLARNALAAHDMEIGRYYLRTGKHLAALNRFISVVQNYQTTEQVQEALYRMTETYLALGLFDEAQASAAVLGYNYPQSKWYDKAYKLMQKYGKADKVRGDVDSLKKSAAAGK